MKTPYECKTFHQPTPHEFVIRVTLEEDPDFNILIKKKDLRLAGYIVRGFLFRKGYSNSTPFNTYITGEQIDLSI